MSVNPGSLTKRVYGDFRGVDFTDNNVALTRSPDSLNMYKDYKNNLGRYIKTRPTLELLKSYDNSIFGLFFYTVNNIKHLIIHSGTKLIDVVDNKETVIKNSGMNPKRSKMFVVNDNLYILDGLNYLQYDGNEIKNVCDIATIPKTHISMSPDGSSTESSLYQGVNLLSGLRKNCFVGDGKTKIYHLDTTDIDSDYVPIVWIDDAPLIPLTDYNYNYTDGTITFMTAPTAPISDGVDNIVIQYRKTIDNHKDRILKCTLFTIFDNRIFFSGNPDYPNVLFWTELNDPTYISDLNYIKDGDSSSIKSLIAGNNALWVLKEPSQNNTAIFYHNPAGSYDALGNYEKTYPSTHSSINTGCVSEGINFNDDIVFFSTRGMEGITGDITTEQILSHRSSFVDNKLLNDSKYLNLQLEEWQGYLLVICGKNVYLADSKSKSTVNDHYEYDWFYWELDKEIICTLVHNDVLYVGTADGIYTLTDETSGVNSYWTTPYDDFGYMYYRKTTSKKGGIANIVGNEVNLYVRTDNEKFEHDKKYLVNNGYVIFKLKKKKWKQIQLKFQSNNFGIKECSLLSYIGSYVKK